MPLRPYGWKYQATGARALGAPYLSRRQQVCTADAGAAHWGLEKKSRCADARAWQRVTMSQLRADVALHAPRAAALTRACVSMYVG